MLSQEAHGADPRYVIIYTGNSVVQRTRFYMSRGPNASNGAPQLKTHRNTTPLYVDIVPALGALDPRQRVDPCQ